MTTTSSTPAKASKKQHHCKRHNVSYGALEQCGKCVDDSGPLPTEVRVPLQDPPSGCVNSEEREAWFTKVANDALADVVRLQEALTPVQATDGTVVEEDWHAEIAIKGHRETAIKAMRAAGELGKQRETDHVVEVRKNEQAGGSH